MGRGGHDTDSKRYIDWVHYAEIDYLSAGILINDEGCLAAAAFHCQQCIEKALKAYLLYKKNRLYDGHNLIWLCRQALNHDTHFEQFLIKCAAVNRFYIETRYPADIPLKIDSELAGDLLAFTQNMLEFISRRIR